MNTIGSLFATLGFNIDDKKLTTFKSLIYGVAEALSLNLISSISNTETELMNFSKQVGISYNKLKDYMNLAEVNNINQNVIKSTFQSIQKQKENLLRGKGNAFYNFLGINLNDDNEKIFNNILEKINNIKDITQKQKILGDLGLDNQLIELADKDLNSLNVTLKSTLINQENLKQLNKSFKELKLTFSNLKVIVISLSKPIIHFIDLINRTINAVYRSIDRFIGIERAIKIVEGAFILLNTVMFPFIAIITAIALAVDDLQTWMDGGVSVIGLFMGKFEDLNPVLKKVFQSIKLILIGLGGFMIISKITKLFTFFSSAVTLALNPVFLIIMAIVAGIAALYMGVNKFIGWKNRREEMSKLKKSKEYKEASKEDKLKMEEELTTRIDKETEANGLMNRFNNFKEDLLNKMNSPEASNNDNRNITINNNINTNNLDKEDLLRINNNDILQTTF